MRKFELALHPDKTRLIRFGRHAAKQREATQATFPPATSRSGLPHTAEDWSRGETRRCQRRQLGVDWQVDAAQ
jgi:hypothetical protein